MKQVQIIGAGLAGLSAAITLSKHNIPCNLISVMPSERAQSVMAEGGINGALNTMGENDTPQEHFEDTRKAGRFIADENAIRGLTESAPEIIKKLHALGVPFHMEKGTVQLRNFGGQKKKRTAFAKSSTGKEIMTALINEVRKYEHLGLVKRYPAHEFLCLILDENKACAGVTVRDTHTDEIFNLYGMVILACGGMNGLFPHETTGTLCNTSDAVAQVFAQGVTLGNPEMIQYHPTTMGISGKRCLVSEAARGEGGRLFIMREGKPWYFMEEKYPELGNLMPRDVVSREMYFVCNDKACTPQVYLDMRGINAKILNSRLSDLCGEIIHYTGINPAKTPIPVEPAIHYFMGGIDVDVRHRTCIKGLYAAGECCMQYHGANRLGGNSMLGAIYGGMTAANDIASGAADFEVEPEPTDTKNFPDDIINPVRPEIAEKIGNLLKKSMGIVRNESELENGLRELESIKNGVMLNTREKNRLALAKALLTSALLRKESRGAHYREDYPKEDETFCKMTVAHFKGGKDACVSVEFQKR